MSDTKKSREVIGTQANANRQARADLEVSEIIALLNEPLPDVDDEPSSKERFISRQWRAEHAASAWTAKFKRRIGLVFIQMKKNIGHGAWEKYLNDAYQAGRIPFGTRAAVNYMAIARETTEEQVEGHNAFDVLVKLGRASAHQSDVADSATKKLKTIWKSILMLGKDGGSLMAALRKNRDPEIVAKMRKLVAEIKLTLDSLDFDLAQKEELAQKWANGDGSEAA